MKEYDLEERTYRFAKQVRQFTRSVPKTLENHEDISQLVRASGSVGSNYIEANGALGKRDFLMRIRISRKEAKESRFFLRLLDAGPDTAVQTLQTQLIQEAQELTNIFGAILKNSE